MDSTAALKSFFYFISDVHRCFPAQKWWSVKMLPAKNWKAQYKITRPS